MNCCWGAHNPLRTLVLLISANPFDMLSNRVPANLAPQGCTVFARGLKINSNFLHFCVTKFGVENKQLKEITIVSIVRTDSFIKQMISLFVLGQCCKMVMPFAKTLLQSSHVVRGFRSF